MLNATLPELAEPLLLKPPEAAKLLGICERTLFGLGINGDIPRVKIGRATRYKLTDVRAFVERMRTS